MSKSSLNSKLDSILNEFDKPIPEHHKESTVTKEVEDKPKKKRAKKNKESTPVSKKTEKKAKVEDLVTLTELAEEAEVSTTRARQILRKEGIEKDEGMKRWEWKPKSKGLKRVRKALGLK